MRQINSPSILAHAVTLLMPFTMIAVIPWLILQGQVHPSSSALRILGGVLFAASLALFVATLRLFILIGKGTLAPWDPTKHLVVVGPYRYCRNPMISGVLGMIIAEAAFFRSGALLLWAAVFFGINTTYFVLQEEPDLLAKHGASYARYKQQVPRWLPRLKPYRETLQAR